MSRKGIWGIGSLKETVAPYLKIKLSNIADSTFIIPNDHILNFTLNYSFNNGIYGILQLYDSYNMGRKSVAWGDLDNFLLKLFNLGRNPQIEIWFGWTNGVQTPSSYKCTVNKVDYKITDTGLLLSIRFVTGGLGEDLIAAQFPFDLRLKDIRSSVKKALNWQNTIKKEVYLTPKYIFIMKKDGYEAAYRECLKDRLNVWLGGIRDPDVKKLVKADPRALQKLLQYFSKVKKYTVAEVIAGLIALYNMGITDPAYQIDPTPKFENCEELESEEKTEALEGFQCAGKTFAQALDQILYFASHPKDNANVELLKSYEWEIIPSPGKNKQGQVIKRKLIIRGINIEAEDSEDIIKRTYFVRCGEKTNVYSLEYTDKTPAMGYFTRLLDCNIRSIILDKETGEMDEIRFEKEKDYCTKSQQLMGKIYGEKYLGDFGEQTTDLPFGVPINLVAEGWDETTAGKALLRRLYQTIMTRTIPSITLAIPGDPKYIIGAKEGKNFVGLQDRIKVIVNSPNGQITPLLTGRYMIVGFSHEISFGNYQTRVYAIKDILKEKTSVSPQEEKFGPEAVA